MKNLSEVKKGEEFRVIEIKGGRGFHSRMASLGLTMGSKVKVLHNYGRGPIIILVRDTRIALGRGEAEKIMVEKEDGTKDN